MLGAGGGACGAGDHTQGLHTQTLPDICPLPQPENPALNTEVHLPPTDPKVKKYQGRRRELHHSIHSSGPAFLLKNFLLFNLKK